MKIANVIASDSWGELLPETLEKGIGGREGSLIYLSREWAKNGLEVTSFGNVSRGKRYKEGDGFHEYMPVSLAQSTLANWEFDVVIAWECPSIFKEEAIRDNIKLKMVEMQCADFPGFREQEYSDRYADHVAVLSEWHKGYMLSRGIETAPDNVVIFPNGIDNTRYPRKEKLPSKPWRFVYSSSPDRGLWYLLKAWPKIRQLDQEAELVITYGIKDWVGLLKWSHYRQAEMAIGIEKLVRQDGIVDFGKVGQRQLAKLQMSAVAWLYPLDAIQATETGCITAIENMAAGNPVITTDCDCMEDEFASVGMILDLPFDEDKFVSTVEFVLNDENAYKTLQEQGYAFAEQRDWSIIAKQWISHFQKHLS